MAFSNYLARNVKRALYRGSVITWPGTSYISLLLSAASGSDTGSTIVEPTSGGYTRYAVVNNTTNWTDAAADGLTDNAAMIQWTNTGATTWVVVGACTCDSLTGGQVLEYGTLTGGSKTFGQNDTFSFNIGDYNALFV